MTRCSARSLLYPSPPWPEPDELLPVMILLVRHGATEWSLNGRHTGRIDLPLTEEGVAQAENVGELIGRILAGRSAIVFTSPLERARHTAALAMPHNEVTVVDALAEYDYGRYEGLTSAQIDGEASRVEPVRRRVPGR